MPNEDVSLKGIVVFLGILAFTIAIVYASITAMWRGFEHQAQAADTHELEHAPTAVAGQPYFPFPREQPHPQEDLNALRTREEIELNSYGWVDRTNGIVRIPIERAMDLLAQTSGGHP